MKVTVNYPPNIKKIRKILDPGPHAVFTYGDTLYNPGNGFIADHLIVHEEIHVKQQTDPEAWWDKYLKDPAFRLEQEIEAYHAQYMFAEKAIKDRNERARFLHAIAIDLSGPMYGKIINYGEAIERIKKG